MCYKIIIIECELILVRALFYTDANILQMNGVSPNKVSGQAHRDSIKTVDGVNIVFIISGQ